jgi:cyclic pyranopterin monophosphate synthase
MRRPKLTHVDARGQARMVDVGDKPETRRLAIAEAQVTLSPAAVRSLRNAKKGDVLAAARIAGIQAAKRTSELIPLCHPIALTHASVDIAVRGRKVVITGRAETTGPTGVEMEALCAVSVAALTMYDMLKAVDRAMRIGPVRLLRKEGGKSGTFRRG